MKKIRVIAGLLISLVLLGLIFRKIDLDAVLHAMSNLNLIWLPVAIIVYFAGIWVRTARWRLLMSPVKICTTQALFPIYIISYMANNILPLRIGDLYRAYIIGRKEAVSKSASLVTVAVERIFDGLTMLLLLAVAFMFYPVEDLVVRQAIRIGSVVFIGAIAACYIIIINKNLAHRLFTMIVLRFPVKHQDRLNEVFDNLFKGLDSLKGFRMIAWIITASFLTWLIEASSYYITLIAFGFWGEFHVAIATMAMVNLLIIVPSAPGYFGPFEMACVIILGKTGYGDVTGFSTEMAAAFALVLHVAVQWIPSTLLGMLYMWKEHLTFKEINNDQNQIRSERSSCRTSEST